ncbi:hypothetical protein HIM_04686 [Hirsutella minnesotensis 3608]|uniref:Calcineurin-like phosphoesterase domain-containing protein n=1 Tax=Hirsutella minnesotensis 3608 TaxID=1043627 RepID=A0A0F8A146_9HYPO|nr:hypothetical protein HIM_04686 [Hirsutella minnesotensis 3608]
MTAMAISQAQQRTLVLAMTFFFIASVYLCTTRLFNMSFTNEPLGRPAAAAAAAAQPAANPYAVRLGPADLPMSYGEYRRPNVDGLKLMARLPRELVPTSANGRRLVIVGDIHGMDAELGRLLDRVGLDAARDHVVSVGDMINKGPASTAVVARLMTLNASAVRGNHEDRVLLSRAEAYHVQGISAELASPESELHRGQAAILAVARSLSREQARWLSELPVILSLEPLPAYVVHAGLVPGVPLAKQDPWAAMNMRSLIYPREELRKYEEQNTKQSTGQQAPPSEHRRPTDASQTEADIKADRAVAVPVENRKGEPWADAWNRHQEQLPESARRTVIYGHDAKTGYVAGNYTLGTDSSCVKGGVLTAIVIEADSDGGFMRTKVQVQCVKRYQKGT